MTRYEKTLATSYRSNLGAAALLGFLFERPASRRARLRALTLKLSLLTAMLLGLDSVWKRLNHQAKRAVPEPLPPSVRLYSIPSRKPIDAILERLLTTTAKQL